MVGCIALEHAQNEHADKHGKWTSRPASQKPTPDHRSTRVFGALRKADRHAVARSDRRYKSTFSLDNLMMAMLAFIKWMTS